QAAAAQAATGGRVDAQVVNTNGKPQANLEFELTAPDGNKHAGKTDGQGALRVDNLPQTGECTLDLPDVTPAPAAAASVEGRLRFVDGGVKLQIGSSSVVEVPARVRRGRLTGMLFDTDKTFLRPEAIAGIRMLKKLYASFPDLVVLVSGHTDKQGAQKEGGAEYNRKLSVDRAKVVRDYLVDDAKEWLPFYTSPQPNPKPWGPREDQLMLSKVLRNSNDPASPPFYT